MPRDGYTLRPAASRQTHEAERVRLFRLISRVGDRPNRRQTICFRHAHGFRDFSTLFASIRGASVVRVTLIIITAVLVFMARSPVLLAVTLGAPTDVTFTASYDGSVQRYMQLLPSDFDPTKQYDIIIALHGSGSTRTQYASNTRDECRATRDVAANHDMIMICPDYRASTVLDERGRRG